MKILLVCIFFFIFPIIFYSQVLTNISSLDSLVKESSGVIYLNQKLITHNDSGGEAALYEIDTLTGSVTRKVTLINASNIDWEDICFDSLYIYIGDFGNNSGARTNLKIYKLLISDYFNTPNDTVIVDSISFSYTEQTNFTPSNYTTNFDAEALISYNDSLFIFTKNWGNAWTNIYVIPKISGTYQLTKIDSINSQGFITGACYNNLTNEIALTGYTFSYPFILRLSGFTGNQFSNGVVERHRINPTHSQQIESITPINNNQYFLTSEMTSSTLSFIYQLNTSYLSIKEIVEHKKSSIYPNPTSKFITVTSPSFSSMEIYDLNGKLQKRSFRKTLDLSSLKKGLYLVIINKNNGKLPEKIKIEVQ